jgi:hypothetical protein
MLFAISIHMAAVQIDILLSVRPLVGYTALFKPSADIANDNVPAVQHEEVQAKEANVSRSSCTSKVRRTANDMSVDNVNRCEHTQKHI